MKYIIAFIFLLLSSFSIYAQSQVQRGCVKTRGRMVDGQHVPGVGLPGAVVSIKDRNDIAIKSKDGSFSFPTKGTQYVVQSVTKKDYTLVDADAAPKTYQHSSNTHYFVMETPEQLLQDKLEKERKIRRALNRQLQDRENEIEKMRAENKITLQKYQEVLQELYDAQKSNEELISEIAEQYVLFDFDQNEEYYQIVSSLIDRGLLLKADSMLRCKGDLKSQILRYFEVGNMIDSLQISFDNTKILYLKNKEELANRCYSYFNSFRLQHNNDSATYYIDLRSQLDTFNVAWQLDAIRYMSQTDTSEAINRVNILINRCLSNSQLNNFLHTLYCIKGDMYRNLYLYERAMSCYELAMSNYLLSNKEYKYLNEFERKGYVPFKKKWLKDKMDLIPIYIGMANCLAELSVFGKGYNGKYIGIYGTNYAFDLYCLAIEISEQVYGVNHYKTVDSYLDFAEWCYMINSLSRSKKICVKSIQILSSLTKDSYPLIRPYLILSDVYIGKRKFKLALEYIQKILDICDETLDFDNRYTLYTIHHKMGIIYSEMKEYNKSLINFNRSVDIGSTIFDDDGIELATLYNNIGFTYGKIGNKSQALFYLKKSYRIRKEKLGENNRYTQISKDNLDYLYKNIK